MRLFYYTTAVLMFISSTTVAAETIKVGLCPTPITFEMHGDWAGVTPHEEITAYLREVQKRELIVSAYYIGDEERELTLSVVGTKALDSYQGEFTPEDFRDIAEAMSAMVAAPSEEHMATFNEIIERQSGEALTVDFSDAGAHIEDDYMTVYTKVSGADEDTAHYHGMLLMKLIDGCVINFNFSIRDEPGSLERLVKAISDVRFIQ